MFLVHRQRGRKDLCSMCGGKGYLIKMKVVRGKTAKIQVPCIARCKRGRV